MSRRILFAVSLCRGNVGARLSFRRVDSNRGEMALSDVLDSLVEELVSDVAHIALVVDIDEGESGVVDGQLEITLPPPRLPRPLEAKLRRSLRMPLYSSVPCCGFSTSDASSCFMSWGSER